jgi:hypothetical protein
MARKLPDLDDLTQAVNTPAGGQAKPAASTPSPAPPAPAAAARRRGRPSRQSQAEEGDAGASVPLTFRLSPELHFWLIQQAATRSIAERRHVTPQEIGYEALEAAMRQAQRKARSSG